MITIKGSDVLSQVVVDHKQQTIATGPNAGDAYYRCRYQGKGFIITQQVYDDLVAGVVNELTLTENAFEIEDPENAGAKIKREGWTYSGHITFEQLIKFGEQQSKLSLGTKRHSIEERKLDIEVMKLEKQAMAEVKLSDKEMKALEAAV